MIFFLKWGLKHGPRGVRRVPESISNMKWDPGGHIRPHFKVSLPELPQSPIEIYVNYIAMVWNRVDHECFMFFFF